jgi:hypothetical protein
MRHTLGRRWRHDGRGRCRAHAAAVTALLLAATVGCAHHRRSQYAYAPPLAPAVYPQPAAPAVVQPPAVSIPAMAAPAPVAAPAMMPGAPVVMPGGVAPAGATVPCDPCQTGMVMPAGGPVVYADGQSPPCPPGP